MTRHVIKDSDDDDEASDVSAPSPDRDSPKVTTDQALLVQHTTSSTDPMLFQAVYDKIFVPRDVPSLDSSSSRNSPSFTQLICDAAAPRMSTSPVSRQKMARSRSANSLSLTSVSETTKVSRKAKRLKSIKDAGGLTQVGISQRSEFLSESDPWGFPSSSASNRSCPLKQVRSRNAEGANGKKTYGKQLKRSKTMMEVSSGHWIESDFLRFSKNNASSGNIEDQLSNVLGDSDSLPVLPELKSRNPGMSVNADIIKKASSGGLIVTDQLPSTKISDLVSTTGEPPSIQVPRSTSQDTSPKPCRGSTGTLIINSVPTQSVTCAASLSTDQPSENSAISIILPNSLTSSQRNQYDSVSLASTDTNRRISPHGSFNDVNQGVEHTRSRGRPSKHPGESSQTPVTSASNHEIPCSLPTSRGSNRIRRARSEVLPLARSSSSNSTSLETSKRLKRSISMKSPGNMPPSQASADELSLVPEEAIEKSRSRNASKLSGKRKRSQEMDDEHVNIDELFGSDEIGLPRERYEPRPSRRRSRNTNLQGLEQDEIDFVKPRAKGAKSAKTLTTSSVSVDEGPNLFEDMETSSHIDANELTRSTLIDTDENFSSRRTCAEKGFEICGCSSDVNNRQQLNITARREENLSSSNDEDGLNLGIPIPTDVLSSGASTQIIDEDGISFPESKYGRETSGVESSKTEVPVLLNAASFIVQSVRTEELGTLDASNVPTQRNTPSNMSDAVQASDLVKLPEVVPSAAIPPAVTAPARKRGRPPGRKKSAPALASPGIVEETMKLQPPEEIAGRGARRSTTAEAATDAPQPSYGQNLTATPTENSVMDLAICEPGPPKETATACAVPKTPSKVGRGQDPHSPLQSGKVPYRVGLSKRNRIAPLLKIIKK
ncbi:MAG: hypothetical protein M1818_001767 [Claussenomyces sp. TS43310]|nr:MAG: hypothetical protein M1818_001767 [Claussenomyces sp. TS43310]